MYRIERRRKAVLHAKQTSTQEGPFKAAACRIAGRKVRTLRIRERVYGLFQFPPPGEKEFPSERAEIGSATDGSNPTRISRLSTCLSKLPCRYSRLRLAEVGRFLTSAQSLAACVIAAILIGCGNPAEAKPFKGERLTVKLAIVGESFEWCDASAAWKLTHKELARVTRGQVAIDYEHDMAVADTRPDLLTLDHFWDSSLGDYWIGQIRPDPKSVRHVALRYLFADGRKMYGGMHYGRGLLGSWFFTNVEPKADCRNALTLAHELGHSFGLRDNCDPNRQSPDIFCWEDAPIYRDCKAPIRYNAIQEREIRRRLGLRVAGKTLCIGEGCK